MDKTDKREYRFTVETIRAGQPRAYADSEYEYIVEVSLPCFTAREEEWTVKQFCTTILNPCFQTHEEWYKNRRDAGKYFAGYHTLEKVGENTYRYYVCRPFCD